MSSHNPYVVGHQDLNTQQPGSGSSASTQPEPSAHGALPVSRVSSSSFAELHAVVSEIESRRESRVAVMFSVDKRVVVHLMVADSTAVFKVVVA